ncbi:MAG TPA: efflux RND transporter periplasmic adaptor subunit [Verrucomicrobiae bacterium]|jgi:multidrug efflux system membrane fusion protein|nr:efflux RND transporter periplasmic adaptor subunit [Verrucomicrobiae bacterium]
MKQRLLFAILATLATIALLAAGCSKPPPAAERPPAAVTANQPIQREVVEWDEFPGRLEAVDMVEVRARVSGYLESVHFKDGAEVKKGDLLFVIDPRQYQAEVDRTASDIAQMESKLELASNDLARADRLLKAKAISEEEADSRSKMVQQMDASLQSSRAMNETAKLNLEYTHITSPIDGRIGRKLITEGNLVNGNQGQSTLLTTIVSLDPIYCYIDADEGAVLKYRQLAQDGNENFNGGKVACELELQNETNYPHKGIIDFVDNMVDPTTGTLRIRGTFTNPGPEHILQPGYFARVRIPGSAKHSGLLIPDEAVGTDQGQKFVYTVSETNTVEYKKITLGPIIDGLRLVRDGLASNDWVIVNGLMSVRPGVKVTATRATPGATATPVAAQ